MGATVKKIEKKKAIQSAVKTEEKAPAKRISKTWEAVLKYKNDPGIEIVDMRAVLK
ncbi:hypothetical protein [Sphingobacterium wenxiniae]|uniref:Uncharacterized protein n=1 Tax=Sphingobacterium wenxiniae TaxID=683125 RepID=A0A1I6VA65_9SPHI|nr:hypothetical protein [Sphingobacterium wenxiniae]SFT10470.1 hypothetical protein SAMN05660206_11223 [Sphingobacterium wenxiniae]